MEFRDYHANLIFEDEHSMSKELLKMDMLIIEKDKDVTITITISQPDR